MTWEKQIFLEGKLGFIFKSDSPNEISYEKIFILNQSGAQKYMTFLG